MFWNICTTVKDLQSTIYRKSWLQINGTSVTIFSGTASDSLESLRHSEFSKKVAIAKWFVKPEKLPPTTVKFHCRRIYLQVMQWMSKSDGMNSTEWGWEVQHGLTHDDMKPAPDKLLKMIHCNCSIGSVKKRHYPPLVPW